MQRFAWMVVLCACAGSRLADGSGADDGDDGHSERFVSLIRAEPFGRLVIEIDSAAGSEPRTQVASAIATHLETLVDKPDGVVATSDGVLTTPGAGHAWSFTDLAALAEASFDLTVPEGTIKLHTLFVDGHHEDDTSSGKILGIAWSHTHLVMFKETLEATCAGVAAVMREEVCAAAEESVWLHEVGHLLGLVDAGLPMVTPHRDPDAEHGRHDENEECVMYWAYEGDAAVDTLLARIVGGDSGALGFDANCLADLAAVRDTPP